MKTADHTFKAHFTSNSQKSPERSPAPLCNNRIFNFVRVMMYLLMPVGTRTLHVTFTPSSASMLTFVTSI